MIAHQIEPRRRHQGRQLLQQFERRRQAKH
jgi:hypothetical protein